MLENKFARQSQEFLASGPSFPLNGIPDEAATQINQTVCQFTISQGVGRGVQHLELKTWNAQQQPVPVEFATIVGMEVNWAPKDPTKFHALAITHEVPAMSYATKDKFRYSGGSLITLPAQGQPTDYDGQFFYEKCDPDSYLYFTSQDGEGGQYDRRTVFKNMSVRVAAGKGEVFPNPPKDASISYLETPANPCIAFLAFGQDVDVQVTVHYYPFWCQTYKIFAGGDWNMYKTAIQQKVAQVNPADKEAVSLARGQAMGGLMKTEEKLKRQTQAETALDGFYWPYGAIRFPSSMMALNWTRVAAFLYANGQYGEHEGKLPTTKMPFTETFDDVMYLSNRKRNIPYVPVKHHPQYLTQQEKQAKVNKVRAKKQKQKEYTAKSKLSGKPVLTHAAVPDTYSRVAADSKPRWGKSKHSAKLTKAQKTEAALRNMFTQEMGKYVPQFGAGWMKSTDPGVGGRPKTQVDDTYVPIEYGPTAAQVKQERQVQVKREQFEEQRRQAPAPNEGDDETDWGGVKMGKTNKAEMRAEREREAAKYGLEL